MSDAPVLSTVEDPRLIREEKLLPLPSTRDGILTVLRRVLTKPYVDRIVVSEAGILVVWSRAMHDSLELDEPPGSIEEVLGRVALVEMSPTPSVEGTLSSAMFLLSMKKLYPSFLLVGSLDSFRDWYGIPTVVSLPEVEGTPYFNFQGMMLREVADLLPSDNLLVLGSMFLGRSLAEVAGGVRIVY